jgi:hypothetical protein
MTGRKLVFNQLRPWLLDYVCLIGRRNVGNAANLNKTCFRMGDGKASRGVGVAK